MLKVLHVVRGMNVGGLENIVKEIILNSDRKTIVCDCLICNEGYNDYESELINAGVNIYKIEEPSQFKWKFYKELKRFFATVPDYDIVHTHLAFSNGIVALAAKCSGIQCVISHSHGVQLPNEGTMKRKPYEFFMRKIACAKSDALMACSQEAGGYLFGRRQFEKKGKLFINGISIEKYAFNLELRNAMRKKLGLSSKTVLGTVGALAPAKNQKHLIRLIKAIGEKNIIALLVGEGPLRDELVEYSIENGIEKQVVFVGKQADVLPYLQAMDVFIFPSISEGFGIALLEAQANGLPCIVSDGIQNEAKIADNIQTLSLNASEGEWICAVKKALTIGRKENIEILKEHGMDLRENCMKLYKLYEEIAK